MISVTAVIVGSSAQLGQMHCLGQEEKQKSSQKHLSHKFINSNTAMNMKKQPIDARPAKKRRMNVESSSEGTTCILHQTTMKSLPFMKTKSMLNSILVRLLDLELVKCGSDVKAKLIMTKMKVE